MCPIPRGWLLNLQYETQITLSSQTAFLHVRERKFPPALSHLLCRPGGAGAPAGAAPVTSNMAPGTRLPGHSFRKCGNPFQVSLSICIPPSLSAPPRHSEQHLVPPLQHSELREKAWSIRETCTGPKGIQNFKYGYRDLSGGLKLRGSRAGNSS